MESAMLSKDCIALTTAATPTTPATDNSGTLLSTSSLQEQVCVLGKRGLYSQKRVLFGLKMSVISIGNECNIFLKPPPPVLPLALTQCGAGSRQSGGAGRVTGDSAGCARNNPNQPIPDRVTSQWSNSSDSVVPFQADSVIYLSENFKPILLQNRNSS